ncbi:putative apoptosis-inducing factor 1, mitochondrial isoform X1 [Drosophila nasuta]|uniref:Apoptosis-inducing factor 1, mitochondrial isoform X1 n=1 Tax=Drosophila albomicans TaxID=7291 RepID=A0A9C6W8G1_DROAB|nr:putative apoptosis-inducing factor 1, mitochondrial isoform X1 [Drosophila albomicans]XP_060663795.1 putative apoptosis-inducing factor 1, mitochondrial isoform X1 [Drosophila nasuta]
MSIWSVRCLCHKFCRQAHILAHRRVISPPTKTAQRLQLALLNSGSARQAHNSLYQMVKKRTLEARTKLQANKYPNHNACMRVPKAVEFVPEVDDEVAQSSVTKLHHSSEVQAQHGQSYNTFQDPHFRLGYADTRSHSTAQDVLKSSQCEKPSEPVSKDVCKETPVDPCEEFNRLRRETAAEMFGSGGDCAGGAGGGGGGDDDKKAAEERYKQLKLKCLVGALGALLAGGFIAWLLSRDSKKTIVDESGEIIDNSEEALKRAKISGLITTPRSSDKLPSSVPYLIIGGGTAAFSAFRAIKSNDARAKVLMISNEFRKPYMRPPLSKELWYTPNPNEDPIKDYRFKQWTGSERSLYFEPEEFFVDPEKLESSANGGIAVAQGFAVKKVDAQNRIVTLNDGYQIGYEVCLIATGAQPKNLPVFRNAPPSVREKVMVYRTPEDFDRLRRYAREKRSITIVGNGFVGSELACSLAHYSKENGGGRVYQVFQEKGNMSKVLPNYLSNWTTRKMEAQGVCVIPDASIKSANRDDTQLRLELNNGMTLLSDIVVVCVGCTPNTSMAGPSKLEVDRSLGGFVVNAELEARRNLYVAGDASCFYDPLLGRRRVEHHDHSVVSGRLAGENMTGAKKPYQHQSMFWSDLGPEIGYEGIGLVDSSLPTVGVFALPSDGDKRADTHNEVSADSKTTDTVIKEGSTGADVTCDPNEEANYGKGVIFYLKNDKIVGILLWNLFNRIGLARTIINQNKTYDDLNEVAKLFEIHT